MKGKRRKQRGKQACLNNLSDKMGEDHVAQRWMQQWAPNGVNLRCIQGFGNEANVLQQVYEALPQGIDCLVTDGMGEGEVGLRHNLLHYRPLVRQKGIIALRGLELHQPPSFWHQVRQRLGYHTYVLDKVGVISL